MSLRLLAIIPLTFIVGILAGLMFSNIAPVIAQSTQSVLELPLLSTNERASPFDRIQESQIHMGFDSVKIDIKNPQWAVFADTNSMDPVIDEGSHAIEIIPQDPSEVHEGDIVSYATEYGTIIHRVIETGQDENGWYAIFKGDNNPINDPDKVRFKDIRRIVVAIIY